jgi:hypothetical protein
MNAAARVEGSDVVAGRGDLIRGGRGREGEGARRTGRVGAAIFPQARGSMSTLSTPARCACSKAATASRRG